MMIITESLLLRRVLQEESFNLCNFTINLPLQVICVIVLVIQPSGARTFIVATWSESVRVDQPI